MNINPISSNSNASFSPFSEDNAIKLLQKQKEMLQDQLQKIEVDKIDDKTRQERIKQLQEQIQQIESEIQQKQSERLNKNQNTNQSQNQNTNTNKINSQANVGNNTGSSNIECVSKLIQAGDVYSQIGVVSKIKNNLDGQGRILKIEIKLDDSRNVDTSEKKELLQKVESKEQKLEGKLGEAIQKVQKQVKEVNESKDKNGTVNKNDESDKVTDSLETQLIESANESKYKNTQKQETEVNGKYRKIDIKI